MDTVIVERAKGVVTATLNRPEKRNAANLEMWEQLHSVITEVAHSHDDRVLVVTGAGGAFCSGADLTDLAGQQGHPLARMRYLGDIALALHRLPKPTIAKVGGVAAGAGCNLALGCDLIVAGSEARFSEIFCRRGLSLDWGGSWLLPRLIGLHRAKELAFFGEILSADEAAAIGLVNRVVPASELDSFVDDSSPRRGTDACLVDEQGALERERVDDDVRGARARGPGASSQLRQRRHRRGNARFRGEAGAHFQGVLTLVTDAPMVPQPISRRVGCRSGNQR